jgi:uncharacterized protein (TIGR02453 family)
MAEPIDLDGFFADSRAFLGALAQNNDRAWFHANKAQYDSALKRPAEKLLAVVAQWLAQEMDLQPRTKLFRPHRDVRFSEDKTPFHSHLHMMWFLPDGRSWMLGIAPDYATMGAGIMRFDAAQEERWRAAVAGPGGATLAALLAEAGWRVDEPALQRVPAPYPEDHPREALLRQRGLIAWADGLEAALAADPEQTVKDRIRGFQPLMDWLQGLR